MLQEGIDYYYQPDGLMVLTEVFLRKRGFCCGKGCRHCLYGYINVTQPLRDILLKEKAEREKNSAK